MDKIMQQNMPRQCDVVVVGGGPAGAIAAGLLAREGFDVVVLEKERFPRPTVGESLIPQFWKFTDLIDASEAIASEGFLQKKGGIVNWGGQIRTISFKTFGFERPALHVERDIFDELLLKKVKQLGARVFEEFKAVEVKEGQGVEVAYKSEALQAEGRLRARYLVDATGQQALLARQEKMRDFDRDFAFQAFWGYFNQSDYYGQGGEVLPFASRRDNGPLTTIASLGDWGWSWHIVLREKVSVGIVLPRSLMDTFRGYGTNLEERFENFARTIPTIGDLLKTGGLLPGSVSSIRDYAYRSRELAIGPCFMAGDAAAFVDPISSEGVPMAMYGGYLSAWAVTNSLREPHRVDFFRQIFRKEYDRRLQVFKMLAYPGTELPPELIEAGKKSLRGFSRQERQLIEAQAGLTGRLDNFRGLFAELTKAI